MPDEDLDLYAYFEIIKFTVFFENTNISSKSVNYGEKVDKPNNPERPGFIFIGWYEEDSTSSNEFDFDNTEIYADTHIYAVWRQAQYHYQIVMGFTGADIPPQDLAPGTTLTEPNIPTRPNYNFVGWFADANFETPFVFPNEMPFSDLTIYACWQAKQNIVLDLKSQEYDFDPFGVSYKSFSDLDGFMVWYFVDGAWTTDSPQRVGTYDVRISRAEDSVYASYEFILEDGLIINYAEKDISIYIVLLFILFGLEIFAIIVLKIMKARKVSKVYAFLPVVISESTIIPNSQFIIMLIACGLVVIGFGYLIYLIVDVHNTAKNESFLPSNLDNRERFKDDLEFQLKNQGDADFETKTKTDETFGEKYSATDIARLLRNDTFKEETLARRKFNVEDNSSTNWNEVSTNKGSDIIAKSKDMKDLVNGKYDSHTPVMFFDEDSDDTASGTTAHNGDAANTSSDSNVKSFENDANGSFAGSEVPADDFSDDDAEK